MRSLSKDNSNATKMVLVLGVISYLFGFTTILLIISGIPYILIHTKCGPSIIYKMYLVPILSKLYINLIAYIQKINNKIYLLNSPLNESFGTNIKFLE